jgi:hypothetical protein
MSFINENFLYSPIRHSVSSPKKKKRKYSSEINQQHQTDNTNINIIDRVLDFSKYKKNTGLYTLCRDWLHATTNASDLDNTNSAKQVKQSSRMENKSTSSNDITLLPMPTRLPHRTERIKPKARPNDNIDLTDLSGDDLLKLNLLHWKSVRKEYMVFCKNDNLAYKESFDVLKSIYEDT